LARRTARPVAAPPTAATPRTIPPCVVVGATALGATAVGVAAGVTTDTASMRVGWPAAFVVIVTVSPGRIAPRLLGAPGPWFGTAEDG